MNKKIEIQIANRYCRKCGKPLLLMEVETMSFNLMTGERMTEFRQMCPDFIAQKGRFFNKLAWLDHDSIPFVDLVRVKL